MKAIDFCVIISHPAVYVSFSPGIYMYVILLGANGVNFITSDFHMLVLFFSICVV
jgi:hypothetical protein